MFTATEDTKGLLYLEFALSKPLKFTSRSRPLSGTPLSVKVVLKVLLDCSCVSLAWCLTRFNCSASPLSLSASSTSVVRHCHSVPFLPLIRSPSRDYQRDLRLTENIIHFHINIALEQIALRIFTMKEYDTRGLRCPSRRRCLGWKRCEV